MVEQKNTNANPRRLEIATSASGLSQAAKRNRAPAKPQALLVLYVYFVRSRKVWPLDDVVQFNDKN